MTRYFRLVDDKSVPERWHLKNPVDAKGGRVDPWQFDAGRTLNVQGRLLFRMSVPGSPLDFTEAGFAIPVIHERVKTLLERLSVQEVQFLAAEVESRSEPYFVLNPTRLIPCIDEARCERLTRWGPEDGRPERVGEYRAVDGLRIDPTKVGGARLFRLWGWPMLIVSEDIKEALEREGVTGTEFIEVS
ncbi:hypothetical protein BO221_17530 [Archangium sp. Cb G35]|uniref:imm11 family protein n=1 Tax=Archangium sp. Cb G35 TaxID=1920190 RepID=UPI0009368613|nr:DUF1629 domain-containing protein [Archangium sp. Cb G35]OJT23775.1 hypothetical protein BO221_17530 [Archangium sp. Cb G35]